MLGLIYWFMSQRIQSSRQAGDLPYRLYSKGPDGVEETDDDIGDKEVQEEVDSLEELSEAANPVTTGDE